MTVTSTIVLNYGDEAAESALVVVELDEVMNTVTDEKGEVTVKTQFYPGDDVYFLVHHDSTVRITSVLCSSGSVAGGDSVSRVRTQQMGFKSPQDEQDLPHIPSTSPSGEWYGRSSSLSLNGRKVKASDTPCIGEISYSMIARQYCLTPPDIVLETEEDQYFILVVINLESVA